MMFLLRILPAMLMVATSFSQPVVPKPFYLTGFAQGTTDHITYYADDSAVTTAQVDSIVSVLDSLVPPVIRMVLFCSFILLFSGTKFSSQQRTVVSASRYVVAKRRIWGFEKVLSSRCEREAIMRVAV